LPRDPLFLATAIDAALSAGRIQRRYFRQQFEIHKKGPIDLVTIADLDAEAAIRAMIAERFPSHVVLGEEGASAPDPSASHRWIVDPLDGTTNFAHGLALFCVSIALEIGGVVEVGAVFDPMAEELFTAERGDGARCNGRRIRVSSCAALADALLCTGFPYSVREERDRQVDVFSAFLGRARGVRRLGSAALDLCYVAAGRLDGFWEEKLHAWDVAAGALIVTEAGGRVTDYRAEPVRLAAPQIVATTPDLLAPMLEVIREARDVPGSGS
jgi:myo-inositol-1(or 4)-monophosphatase